MAREGHVSRAGASGSEKRRVQHDTGIVNETLPEKVSRYSDGLRAGRPGFYSRQRQETFLCCIASRPALWPTQPPVHWVPGTFCLGVMRPGREVDHSCLSNAENENIGAVLSPSHMYS
jgi:hypothetical protein